MRHTMFFLDEVSVWFLLLAKLQQSLKLIGEHGKTGTDRVQNYCMSLYRLRLMCV